MFPSVSVWNECLKTYLVMIPHKLLSDLQSISIFVFLNTAKFLIRLFLTTFFYVSTVHVSLNCAYIKCVL